MTSRSSYIKIHDKPLLRLPSSRHLCRRPFLVRRAYCAKSENSFLKWIADIQGVEYSYFASTESEEGYNGFTLKRDSAENEIVLEFPSSLSITKIDADGIAELRSLTEGRSELIKLALWLIHEKQKGDASPWHPFVTSLPERTLSPILWSSEELSDLCFGSSIVEEAALRREALLAEWGSIRSSNQKDLPAGFDEAGFLDAFSVVLAHSYFLPSAGMFALLPPLLGIHRTGNADGCTLDYDPDRDAVVLTTQTTHQTGEKVRILDGRPSSEMFLSTGSLEVDNSSDYITLEFELVEADRLYIAKKEILDSLGYQSKESFPIYSGRIPLELLSFLRLSRIQESSDLAKVSFENDQIVNELNEYEVLQLVLAECRIRLSQYKQNMEADIKSLQSYSISEKERIATEMLLSEKKILQSCVDLMRNKLAPIRGIPTKSGKLEDPNKDIAQIFETIESIPKAPKELLDGFLSWAKGDNDPEWKKRRKE